MKVGILVYDGCVQFEIVLAAYFSQTKYEIVTFALEMRDHRSAEGFLLRPHRLLPELEPDAFDAFIIPGGDPQPILGNRVLAEKLVALNERGRLIAAVCAAPVHLSHSGVLEDRRFTSSLYAERKELFLSGTYSDEDVVVDGNIITGWPNAYVDFALAVGDHLGIFTSQADREETVRVFREFRRY
jgi:putative intracellular protease/amidase